MTLVLIQPAYGNPTARQHWRDTLDQLVPFDSEPHVSALSEAQREELFGLHPSGSARFWGSTANQDRIMDEVGLGDVVVFTGLNAVRGIGEVGCLFRNAAFADTLWSPDPVKGSWHNVYSLRSFEPVEIPYPVLREALGSDPNDVFMGLRLIRDQRVGHVLDALGVRTTTSAEQELNDARRAARELAHDVGEEARLPPEQTHSSGGSYLLSEREIVFGRVESLLVQSYRNSLPPGVTTDRIRCKVGLTDLCVTVGGSTEVLEAKAHASHPYVRHALGQILDYTHSITAPIATIAALFPSRPSNDDVALLNHYGVDCVYRSASGAFSRETANPSRRGIWKSA